MLEECWAKRLQKVTFSCKLDLNQFIGLINFNVYIFHTIMYNHLYSKEYVKSICTWMYEQNKSWSHYNKVIIEIKTSHSMIASFLQLKLYYVFLLKNIPPSVTHGNKQLVQEIVWIVSYWSKPGWLYNDTWFLLYSILILQCKKTFVTGGMWSHSLYHR